MSLDTCVRYIGQGDATGYGIAAAALVRALRDAGVDVVWDPVLPGGDLGLGYAPAVSPHAGPSDLWGLRDDGKACDTVVIHLVPEYYPHFIRRAQAAGARRIIGHTVWETDRLPDHWPALINLLDAVIVPTAWNRDVLRQCAVKVPILVAPHLPCFGDRPVADPAALRPYLPDLTGRRVFYTLSTWLERKGIGPLVDAFSTAFGPDDPVALIIKTTAHDLERVRSDPGHAGEPLAVRPQFEAMIARAAQRNGRAPAPIHLVTDELSDGAVGALHEMGDCFVSLCRAEGWGLGAFEAAWLGKPVVITGWGGPTAFLSPRTAYLVDWTLAPVRPARPNTSYTGRQNWAEPDIGSAVAALRAVADDPAQAQRRGAMAAASLRRRIVPDVVSRDLMDAMRALPPRPSHPPAGVAASDDPALSAPQGATRSEHGRVRTLLDPWFVRAVRAWTPFPFDLPFASEPECRAARPVYLPRLMRKKNGRPRPMVARWLGLDAEGCRPDAARRHRDRRHQMQAQAGSTPIREIRILHGPRGKSLARHVRDSLADTPLACRLGAGLPPYADVLFLVVDPLDLLVRPHPSRSLHVLTHLDGAMLEPRGIAELGASRAVLVPTLDMMECLQRHGLPAHRIHYVPHHPPEAGDDAMPPDFSGTRALLLRTLDALGLLNAC